MSSDDLYEMIDDGDIQAIQSALENDPSLASANAGYDQPIHVAAGNNKSDVVELLVRFGADVNARDQDQRTPLHRAAELGPETVKVLLHAGANPNVYDKYGYTPLAWAISGQQSKSKKVLTLLREGGANYGLLEAAGMGDLLKVEEILSLDSDAVSKEPSQETLLSMAWSVGTIDKAEDRTKIVKLLLNHNINLTSDKLIRHADACESQNLHAIASMLRAYANR